MLRALREGRKRGVGSEGGKRVAEEGEEEQIYNWSSQGLRHRFLDSIFVLLGPIDSILGDINCCFLRSNFLH